MGYTPFTGTSGIHSRALLVSLSATTWAARKYDRELTNELLDDKGAEKGTARVNKHLLANCPEYKALISAIGAMRNLHYDQTLPWADEGWRLLPAANYAEYTRMMRAAHDKVKDALAAFVPVYPAAMQKAAVDMNGLFRASDYPKPREIAGRFSITIDYSPVPTFGDLRVELDDAEKQEIAASIERRMARATHDAVQAAWDRLAESVTHLKDRLNEIEDAKSAATPRRTVLRDALVTNVQETVDVLGRLNVTDDPKLEAARRKVAGLVMGLEADDLRKSSGTRQATVREAERILTAMNAIRGS